MSKSFLVCAVITAISSLISLGFSIAALKSAAGTARTLALYTCARSLSICGISFVPFLNGSSQWLAASASAMIAVQAFDALVGVTLKDRMKTFGPMGTATTNLIALAWFLHWS